MQHVMDFSHSVGISCNGLDTKLAAVFAYIIDDNERQGEAEVKQEGNKGLRELNNLLSSYQL